MRRALWNARALAAVLGLLLLSSGASAELVGYWNFDGQANDQSGQGNHGTLAGDAAYDADVPAAIGGGQSVLLDGDNDYVDLGNPAILDMGTGNWTVSGWVRTTMSGTGDANKGTVYGKGGDSGGGHRYTLGVSEQGEGNMSLTCDDNSSKVQAESRRDVNDDAWYHVAGVRRGDRIEVYVNGAMERANTLPGGYDLSGTSQHGAYVGAITHHGGGDYLYKFLNGRADDVAVWNEDVPETFIAQLAAGGVTPKSSTAAEDPIVRINFQTTSSAGMPGYEPDTGQLFGDQGNGWSYGWDRDMTGRARDRNNGSSPDERYDTLVHFKRSGGNDDPSDHGTWELEIANGVYDVFLVAGDPSYTDSTNTINVEGVLFEDLDGEDNFDAYYGTVQVTDGALTLYSPVGSGDDLLLGQGSNAKIAFLEVRPGGDIPEPATLALLSLAAAGLGGYVRRRRTARA